MADPVTLAVVGSTVLSAVGSIQAGNAAKAEADYNARIQRQNAEIAKQQTEAQLETQDRERRLRQGAAIASSGASGVGLSSFEDVLASNAMQEELDLLTIESEGLLRQRNFESQANLLTAQGKQAQTAGYINAGSKLLSGGADFLGPSMPPKPGRKPVRS